eukprot:TRINITY_DN38901_c0_g1_i1.p1 TRINITY_DN38901_c0_g1~~TRINITY_DN38901_c0_g1_i1.p1  ORF type:complete len:190 (-),score=27.47 TRINITY_DN38901_c0_g1_i1:29-598(-)
MTLLQRVPPSWQAALTCDIQRTRVRDYCAATDICGIQRLGPGIAQTQQQQAALVVPVVAAAGPQTSLASGAHASVVGPVTWSGTYTGPAPPWMQSLASQPAATLPSPPWMQSLGSQAFPSATPISQSPASLLRPPALTAVPVSVLAETEVQGRPSSDVKADRELASRKEDEKGRTKKKKGQKKAFCYCF